MNLVELSNLYLIYKLAFIKNFKCWFLTFENHVQLNSIIWTGIGVFAGKVEMRPQMLNWLQRFKLDNWAFLLGNKVFCLLAVPQSLQHIFTNISAKLQRLLHVSFYLKWYVSLCLQIYLCVLMILSISQGVVSSRQPWQTPHVRLCILFYSIITLLYNWHLVNIAIFPWSQYTRPSAPQNSISFAFRLMLLNKILSEKQQYDDYLWVLFWPLKDIESTICIPKCLVQ